MITESEYEKLAVPELHKLVEALDALETDDVEAELESDILTLEFSDGARYVINSHRAARQIWMAAERSAWHFDWDATQNAWVAKKTGDELWQTLTETLARKLGQPVQLQRNA